MADLSVLAPLATIIGTIIIVLLGVAIARLSTGASDRPAPCAQVDQPMAALWRCHSSMR